MTLRTESLFVDPDFDFRSTLEEFCDSTTSHTLELLKDFCVEVYLNCFHEGILNKLIIALAVCYFKLFYLLGNYLPRHCRRTKPHGGDPTVRLGESLSADYYTLSTFLSLAADSTLQGDIVLDVFPLLIEIRFWNSQCEAKAKKYPLHAEASGC